MSVRTVYTGKAAGVRNTGAPQWFADAVVSYVLTRAEKMGVDPDDSFLGIAPIERSTLNRAFGRVAKEVARVVSGSVTKKALLAELSSSRKKSSASSSSSSKSSKKKDKSSPSSSLSSSSGKRGKSASSSSSSSKKNKKKSKPSLSETKTSSSSSTSSSKSTRKTTNKSEKPSSSSSSSHSTRSSSRSSRSTRSTQEAVVPSSNAESTSAKSNTPKSSTLTPSQSTTTPRRSTRSSQFSQPEPDSKQNLPATKRKQKVAPKNSASSSSSTTTTTSAATSSNNKPASDQDRTSAQKRSTRGKRTASAAALDSSSPSLDSNNSTSVSSNSSGASSNSSTAAVPVAQSSSSSAPSSVVAAAQRPGKRQRVVSNPHNPPTSSIPQKRSLTSPPSPTPPKKSARTKAPKSLLPQQEAQSQEEKARAVATAAQVDADKTAADKLTGVARIMHGMPLTKPIPVQFVEISRFSQDMASLEALEATPVTLQENGKPDYSQAIADGYDIVISDGARKSRVVLAPTFNNLVRRGAIQPGAVVKVHQAVRKYNEGEPHHPGAIVLTNVEVYAPTAPVIASSRPLTDSSAVKLANSLTEAQQASLGLGMGLNHDRIKWMAGVNTVEEPLMGSRGTYMDLYADEVPVDDVRWRQLSEVVEHIPLAEIYNLERKTIAEIKSRFPPESVSPDVLIGRVVSKSRLIYYGNPGTKQKFPFQFIMNLHDGTDTIQAVVWNRSCLDLFSTIYPGHVIAVNNYRLRAARPGTRGVEISINPHHPPAKVSIVDEQPPPDSRGNPDWEKYPRPVVPRIEYDVRNVAEVANMTNGEHFDCVGLLLNVGRVALERSEKGRASLYRWLTLTDNSSTVPRAFQVKLYANSQPNEFFAPVLRAGALVFITRLVVWGADLPGTNAGSWRWFFARTTNESQLYVGNALPVNIEPVSKMMAWTEKACEAGDEALGSIVSPSTHPVLDHLVIPTHFSLKTAAGCAATARGSGTTGIWRALHPLWADLQTHVGPMNLDTFRETLDRTEVVPLSFVQRAMDNLQLHETSSVLLSAVLEDMALSWSSAAEDAVVTPDVRVIPLSMTLGSLNKTGTLEGVFVAASSDDMKIRRQNGRTASMVEALDLVVESGLELMSSTDESPPHLDSAMVDARGVATIINKNWVAALGKSLVGIAVGNQKSPSASFERLRSLAIGKRYVFAVNLQRVSDDHVEVLVAAVFPHEEARPSS